MSFLKKMFGVKNPVPQIVKSDPEEVRRQIDRIEQAEKLLNSAMENFENLEGEKVGEALTMIDAAMDFVSRAHEIDPNNDEVCKLYAKCYSGKGSVLWKEGFDNEAYEAFMTALRIGGYEELSFKMSRQLARKKDEMFEWLEDCMRMGIATLQD